MQDSSVATIRWRVLQYLLITATVTGTGTDTVTGTVI